MAHNVLDHRLVLQRTGAAHLDELPQRVDHADVRLVVERRKLVIHAPALITLNLAPDQRDAGFDVSELRLRRT